MADLIEAIIKTRKTSGEIASLSLLNIENTSEIELCKSILSKMSASENIFPKGWYDPPAGGVSVLFDEAPFECLLYDSLRNPEYSPQERYRFKKETVGGIYFSPVNKTTNMLADIGFTIYKGENEEIKQHLKKSYDVIYKIAEHAEVGMKFSDLCKFALDLFHTNNLKPSRRSISSTAREGSG